MKAIFCLFCLTFFSLSAQFLKFPITLGQDNFSAELEKHWNFQSDLDHPSQNNPRGVLMERFYFEDVWREKTDLATSYIRNFFHETSLKHGFAHPRQSKIWGTLVLKQNITNLDLSYNNPPENNGSDTTLSTELKNPSNFFAEFFDNIFEAILRPDSSQPQARKIVSADNRPLAAELGLEVEQSLFSKRLQVQTKARIKISNRLRYPWKGYFLESSFNYLRSYFLKLRFDQERIKQIFRLSLPLVISGDILSDFSEETYQVSAGFAGNKYLSMEAKLLLNDYATPRDIPGSRFFTTIQGEEIQKGLRLTLFPGQAWQFETEILNPFSAAQGDLNLNVRDQSDLIDKIKKMPLSWTSQSQRMTLKYSSRSGGFITDGGYFHQQGGIRIDSTRLYIYALKYHFMFLKHSTKYTDHGIRSSFTKGFKNFQAGLSFDYHFIFPEIYTLFAGNPLTAPVDTLNQGVAPVKEIDFGVAALKLSYQSQRIKLALSCSQLIPIRTVISKKESSPSIKKEQQKKVRGGGLVEGTLSFFY